MIGTILSNRYKLEEEIGVGGTAVVYKAKDTILNRNVAVKVLKNELSDDDDFVAKFKREATSVASISDINIVNIYDVGADGKINYIVMEYIDGKTLKEIIKQEKEIDIKKIIAIAVQITKALDCAHKNNIIHRDIKPHNIMVTKDGLVKVTDFGIAKASNSVTITSTNKVVGSAHYLSPEQAQGKQVDCRTDIYSFGIVLYEMATGKVPHDADTPVSVALKHIQEPVIPPKNLNENIPDSLNRLILKCLEKNPDDRYQNTRQILNDLIRMKSNYKIDDFDETMNVNDEEDYTRVMEPVKAKGLEKNADKNKAPVPDDEFDEDEEDIDEDEPKNNKKNKKKKIITASIIGVILLAGCVLFFALGAGLLGTSAVGKVSVPKIRGLKEGDAKKAVTDAKLKFEVVQRTKSDKPAGTVIACSPSEGTEVDEGSTVRVDVSSGEDDTKVPSLFGLTESEAKDKIISAGYKVGDISKESSDVPKGCVVRQTPDEGSSLEKGKTIDLVISTGPKESDNVSVPGVQGQSESDAKQTLENAGFTVNIQKKITNDPNQNGLVYSQNPGAGAMAAKNSVITIVVYQYNSTAQSNTNNNNNNNNNNTGSQSTGTNGNTKTGQQGGSNTTPTQPTNTQPTNTQPSGNNTTNPSNGQGGSNNQTGGGDKK
ncbi:Stk1 family PASTA domain-containing Ser/Thr kinase [Clostridium neuense]|uniref:non-specific serine/threonine protein kinase n=1 Tax=Clostridium neuense TaxID=1728934 RepID=A0ABW8TE11_9CLOT